MTGVSSGAKVLRSGEGEWHGPPDGVRDRFVLPGSDSEHRFSLVEHLAPPGALIRLRARPGRHDGRGRAARPGALTARQTVLRFGRTSQSTR